MAFSSIGVTCRTSAWTVLCDVSSRPGFLLFDHPDNLGFAVEQTLVREVRSLVIAGIAYCVSGIFAVLVLSVVMYVRQKDEFAREYLLE